MLQPLLETLRVEFVHAEKRKQSLTHREIVKADRTYLKTGMKGERDTCQQRTSST